VADIICGRFDPGVYGNRTIAGTERTEDERRRRLFAGIRCYLNNNGYWDVSVNSVPLWLVNRGRII
jgi:hypothetical protein